MFDTFITSVIAFLKGDLFQDLPKVLAKQAAGVASALAVFFGVAIVAPYWTAAIAAGLAGGLAQPLLFKNLKYK